MPCHAVPSYTMRPGDLGLSSGLPSMQCCNGPRWRRQTHQSVTTGVLLARTTREARPKGHPAGLDPRGLSGRLPLRDRVRVKPQINDGLALCRPYLHRSWLVLFVLQPGRNGTARGTEARASWGRLGAASPWTKPTRWVPMKRFSCRDFAPCGREGFQEKGEGGGLMLRCVGESGSKTTTRVRTDGMARRTPLE